MVAWNIVASSSSSSLNDGRCKQQECREECRIAKACTRRRRRRTQERQHTLYSNSSSMTASRGLLQLLTVILTTTNSSLTTIFAQVDLSCNVDTDTTCPYQVDGECDSELGLNIFGCTNGDCFDCRIYCEQYNYDCNSCLMNGCYYCPEDATCYNSDTYDFMELRNVQSSCTISSEYIHTGFPVSNTAVQDTCSATLSTNMFNDPLYNAQSWVFDMIDVVPVWERGFTGNGVRIRINDDGVAADHEEFDGRFDASASCGNDYLPRNPVEDHSHGTFVASIAAGAADNNICSVGISPKATISACYVFGFNENVLGEKLDRIDVSSNSWGAPGCWPADFQFFSENSSHRNDDNDDDEDETDIRRQLQNNDSKNTAKTRRRKLQSCPFTYTGNLFEDTPCDLCNFNSGGGFSNTPVCEASIILHCSLYYENDQEACVEFIDLLVSGGECNYNTLSETERQAFANGVTQGRDGKGVIFIFASGNDYGTGDDVNFQGLLNTRLTISVGAVGKDGSHSSYSTPGAALFVSGPGGDHESVSSHVVAYAGGGCADSGVGTSFSCPVVSGVVALMLEANPNLGWRDVQGIIALTSKAVTNDRDDDTVITNAAGYRHSNFYGFGIINANDAVTAALEWDNFPPEEMLEAETGLINLPIVDSSSTPTVSSATLTASSSEVNFFTESVVLLLDIRHFSRGDLEIGLTSPEGTKSLLHPGKRPETTQLDVDERWKLMTVRNWGEDPFGEWQLSVADIESGDVDSCADHLWDMNLSGLDETIGCAFFERLEYCSNGSVNTFNLKADNAEFLLNREDEDLGLTFAEACCECGGGRTRNGNTVDEVVQWKVLVYGHSLDNPSPSVAPSPSPSLKPSVQPSESFKPTRGASPAPNQSSMPSQSTKPSTAPSLSPSQSSAPTTAPSHRHTASMNPSTTPSVHPTQSSPPSPSNSSTPSSSTEPSSTPTSSPSTGATSAPTKSSPPSVLPSTVPNGSPSLQPSVSPSISLSPVEEPPSDTRTVASLAPTKIPAFLPSAIPSVGSATPTSSESATPTDKSLNTPPSMHPSVHPSMTIDNEAPLSNIPSLNPTDDESNRDPDANEPSDSPSVSGSTDGMSSDEPSSSAYPSASPSNALTSSPSLGLDTRDAGQQLTTSTPTIVNFLDNVGDGSNNASAESDGISHHITSWVTPWVAGLFLMALHVL